MRRLYRVQRSIDLRLTVQIDLIIAVDHYHPAIVRLTVEQHAQRARSTEFDIVRKGDVVKTRDGGRLAVSLDEPGVIRICRCRKERNAIIRAVRSHQVAIRGQNAEINARAIHARLIFSILYAHTDSEFLERIAIFARVTERITFRRSVLHTDTSIRRGNGVLFIFAPTVGVPGLNLGL